MAPRPFRFTTSMPPLRAPVAAWRDEVRRIEGLGFSSVAISDHLTGGWEMDPIVAMTAAAEATTELRILAMVFCNDFRHPALLHRSMANLDTFSAGRLEIGLGAGWKEADYRASGVPFDPPSVRISRLAESVDVIQGLFGAEPLTYHGEHYRISGLTGLPRPVQQPHPPLFVGGGSRRVLELAGRRADIVGVNPRLASGVDHSSAAEEMSPSGLERKLAWIRSAAVAAGRRPDQVELQSSLLDVRVTHRGIEHRWTSSLARNASPEALVASPASLHGDLDKCVDLLLERRETYGISYVHLGGNRDAAALILSRLAGR